MDSSENPIKFIRLLEKKIKTSCFLGSRAATNKKNYKPFMMIEGKRFSDSSYAVQLLSGSIHLKLH